MSHIVEASEAAQPPRPRFLDSDPQCIASSKSTHDAEQLLLMENDMCIVVDDQDMPIGHASKRSCHELANINKGLLHRAFSVFLFNSRNQLLLQQRASEKITFPDMWTNTCCSHPLSDGDEGGAFPDAAILGVKRAARRKLLHELGIPGDQVAMDQIKFVGRIHYAARSDAVWGEHEIDYMLLVKADVETCANRNEVQDVRYVSPGELEELCRGGQAKFTPWFRLVRESGLLASWWESIDGGTEPGVEDAGKILRM